MRNRHFVFSKRRDRPDLVRPVNLRKFTCKFTCKYKFTVNVDQAYPGFRAKKMFDVNDHVLKTE